MPNDNSILPENPMDNLLLSSEDQEVEGIAPIQANKPEEDTTLASGQPELELTAANNSGQIYAANRNRKKVVEDNLNTMRRIATANTNRINQEKGGNVEEYEADLPDTAPAYDFANPNKSNLENSLNSVLNNTFQRQVVGQLDAAFKDVSRYIPDSKQEDVLASAKSKYQDLKEVAELKTRFMNKGETKTTGRFADPDTFVCNDGTKIRIYNPSALYDSADQPGVRNKEFQRKKIAQRLGKAEGDVTDQDIRNYETWQTFIAVKSTVEQSTRQAYEKYDPSKIGYYQQYINEHNNNLEVFVRPVREARGISEDVFGRKFGQIISANGEINISDSLSLNPFINLNYDLNTKPLYFYGNQYVQDKLYQASKIVPEDYTLTEVAATAANSVIDSFGQIGQGMKRIFYGITGDQESLQKLYDYQKRNPSYNFFFVRPEAQLYRALQQQKYIDTMNKGGVWNFVKGWFQAAFDSPLLTTAESLGEMSTLMLGSGLAMKLSNIFKLGKAAKFATQLTGIAMGAGLQETLGTEQEYLAKHKGEGMSTAHFLGALIVNSAALGLELPAIWAMGRQFRRLVGLPIKASPVNTSTWGLAQGLFKDLGISVANEAVTEPFQNAVFQAMGQINSITDIPGFFSAFVDQWRGENLGQRGLESAMAAGSAGVLSGQNILAGASLIGTKKLRDLTGQVQNAAWFDSNEDGSSLQPEEVHTSTEQIKNLRESVKRRRDAIQPFIDPANIGKQGFEKDAFDRAVDEYQTVINALEADRMLHSSEYTKQDLADHRKLEAQARANLASVVVRYAAANNLDMQATCVDLFRKLNGLDPNDPIDPSIDVAQEVLKLAAGDIFNSTPKSVLEDQLRYVKDQLNADPDNQSLKDKVQELQDRIDADELEITLDDGTKILVDPEAYERFLKTYDAIKDSLKTPYKGPDEALQVLWDISNMTDDVLTKGFYGNSIAELSQRINYHAEKAEGDYLGFRTALDTINSYLSPNEQLTEQMLIDAFADNTGTKLEALRNQYPNTEYAGSFAQVEQFFKEMKASNAVLSNDIIQYNRFLGQRISKLTGFTSAILSTFKNPSKNSVDWNYYTATGLPRKLYINRKNLREGSLTNPDYNKDKPTFLLAQMFTENRTALMNYRTLAKNLVTMHLSPGLAQALTIKADEQLGELASQWADLLQLQKDIQSQVSPKVEATKIMSQLSQDITPIIKAAIEKMPENNAQQVGEKIAMMQMLQDGSWLSKSMLVKMSSINSSISVDPSAFKFKKLYASLNDAVKQQIRTIILKAEKDLVALTRKRTADEISDAYVDIKQDLLATQPYKDMYANQMYNLHLQMDAIDNQQGQQEQQPTDNPTPPTDDGSLQVDEKEIKEEDKVTPDDVLEQADTVEYVMDGICNALIQTNRFWEADYLEAHADEILMSYKESTILGIKAKDYLYYGMTMLTHLLPSMFRKDDQQKIRLITEFNLPTKTGDAVLDKCIEAAYKKINRTPEVQALQNVAYWALRTAFTDDSEATIQRVGLSYAMLLNNLIEVEKSLKTTYLSESTLAQNFLRVFDKQLKQYKKDKKFTLKLNGKNITFDYNNANVGKYAVYDKKTNSYKIEGTNETIDIYGAGKPLSKFNILTLDNLLTPKITYKGNTISYSKDICTGVDNRLAEILADQKKTGQTYQQFLDTYNKYWDMNTQKWGVEYFEKNSKASYQIMSDGSIRTRPGSSPNTWNGIPLSRIPKEILPTKNCEVIGKGYSNSGSEYLIVRDTVTGWTYENRVKFIDPRNNGRDQGVADGWALLVYGKNENDSDDIKAIFGVESGDKLYTNFKDSYILENGQYVKITSTDNPHPFMPMDTAADIVMNKKVAKDVPDYSKIGVYPRENAPTIEINGETYYDMRHIHHTSTGYVYYEDINLNQQEQQQPQEEPQTEETTQEQQIPSEQVDLSTATEEQTEQVLQDAINAANEATLGLDVNSDYFKFIKKKATGAEVTEVPFTEENVSKVANVIQAFTDRIKELQQGLLGSRKKPLTPFSQDLDTALRSIQENLSYLQQYLQQGNKNASVQNLLDKMANGTFYATDGKTTVKMQLPYIDLDTGIQEGTVLTTEQVNNNQSFYIRGVIPDAPANQQYKVVKVQSYPLRGVQGFIQGSDNTMLGVIEVEPISSDGSTVTKDPDPIPTDGVETPSPDQGIDINAHDPSEQPDEDDLTDFEISEDDINNLSFNDLDEDYTNNTEDSPIDVKIVDNTTTNNNDAEIPTDIPDDIDFDPSEALKEVENEENGLGTSEYEPLPEDIAEWDKEFRKGEGSTITPTPILQYKGMEHLTARTPQERNSYNTGWYAGIGGHEISKLPGWVENMFTGLGMILAEEGLGLRSGHAKCCDTYFETGANYKQGAKEIWDNSFARGNLYGNNEQLIDIAVSVHPIHERLIGPRFTIKGKDTNEFNAAFSGLAMARNGYQVLGADLNTPVDFVLCYAPLDKDGEPTGGTAQAIRMAKVMNIPVFNFAEDTVNKGLKMEAKFRYWYENYYSKTKPEDSKPKKSTPDSDDRLKIQSNSNDATGRALSPFNLKIDINGTEYTVESAYQASKFDNIENENNPDWKTVVAMQPAAAKTARKATNDNATANALDVGLPYEVGVPMAYVALYLSGVGNKLRSDSNFETELSRVLEYGKYQDEFISRSLASQEDVMYYLNYMLRNVYNNDTKALISDLKSFDYHSNSSLNSTLFTTYSTWFKKYRFYKYNWAYISKTRQIQKKTEDKIARDIAKLANEKDYNEKAWESAFGAFFRALYSNNPTRNLNSQFLTSFANFLLAKVVSNRGNNPQYTDWGTIVSNVLGALTTHSKFKEYKKKIEKAFGNTKYILDQTTDTISNNSIVVFAKENFDSDVILNALNGTDAYHEDTYYNGASNDTACLIHYKPGEKPLFILRSTGVSAVDLLNATVKYFNGAYDKFFSNEDSATGKKITTILSKLKDNKTVLNSIVAANILAELSGEVNNDTCHDILNKILEAANLTDAYNEAAQQLIDSTVHEVKEEDKPKLTSELLTEISRYVQDADNPNGGIAVNLERGVDAVLDALAVVNNYLADLDLTPANVDYITANQIQDLKQKLYAEKNKLCNMINNEKLAVKQTQTQQQEFKNSLGLHDEIDRERLERKQEQKKAKLTEGETEFLNEINFEKAELESDLLKSVATSDDIELIKAFIPFREDYTEGEALPTHYIYTGAQDLAVIKKYRNFIRVIAELDTTDNGTPEILKEIVGNFPLNSVKRMSVKLSKQLKELPLDQQKQLDEWKEDMVKVVNEALGIDLEMGIFSTTIREKMKRYGFLGENDKEFKPFKDYTKSQQAALIVALIRSDPSLLLFYDFDVTDEGIKFNINFTTGFSLYCEMMKQFTQFNNSTNVEGDRAIGKIFGMSEEEFADHKEKYLLTNLIQNVGIPRSSLLFRLGRDLRSRLQLSIANNDSSKLFAKDAFIFGLGDKLLRMMNAYNNNRIKFPGWNNKPATVNYMFNLIKKVAKQDKQIANLLSDEFTSLEIEKSDKNTSMYKIVWFILKNSKVLQDAIPRYKMEDSDTQNFANLQNLIRLNTHDKEGILRSLIDVTTVDGNDLNQRLNNTSLDPDVSNNASYGQFAEEVNFIKIHNLKQGTDAGKRANTRYNYLDSMFPNPDATRGISFDKPIHRRGRTVDNFEKTPLSSMQDKVLQTLEETPHQIDLVAYEMFEKYENAIYRLEGGRTETNKEGLTAKEITKDKSLTCSRSFAIIKALVEHLISTTKDYDINNADATKTDSFFLKYEVMKNMRFNCASTFNPQGDKAARWLSFAGDFHKFDVNNGKHLKWEAWALAQAFDMVGKKGETDKCYEILMDICKDATKLANFEQDVCTMTDKQLEAKYGLGMENRFQCIAAVAHLKRRAAAMQLGHTTFDTTLRAEIDSTTSGYFIKLMTILDANVLKMFGIKVGIWDDLMKLRSKVEEGVDIEAYETMENIKKAINDIYRQIGINMSKDNKKALHETWDNIEHLSPFLKFNGFLDDKSQFLAFVDALPSATQDEEGNWNVSSELRALLKPVVMVFGYSAGEGTLEHRLSEAVMEKYETAINDIFREFSNSISGEVPTKEDFENLYWKIFNSDDKMLKQYVHMQGTYLKSFARGYKHTPENDYDNNLRQKPYYRVNGEENYYVYELIQKKINAGIKQNEDHGNNIKIYELQRCWNFYKAQVEGVDDIYGRHYDVLPSECIVTTVTYDNPAIPDKPYSLEDLTAYVIDQTFGEAMLSGMRAFNAISHSNMFYATISTIQNSIGQELFEKKLREGVHKKNSELDSLYKTYMAAKKANEEGATKENAKALNDAKMKYEVAFKGAFANMTRGEFEACFKGDDPESQFVYASIQSLFSLSEKRNSSDYETQYADVSWYNLTEQSSPDNPYFSITKNDPVVAAKGRSNIGSSDLLIRAVMETAAGLRGTAFTTQGFDAGVLTQAILKLNDAAIRGMFIHDAMVLAFDDLEKGSEYYNQAALLSCSVYNSTLFYVMKGLKALAYKYPKLMEAIMKGDTEAVKKLDKPLMGTGLLTTLSEHNLHSVFGLPSWKEYRAINPYAKREAYIEEMTQKTTVSKLVTIMFQEAEKARRNFANFYGNDSLSVKNMGGYGKAAKLSDIKKEVEEIKERQKNGKKPSMSEYITKRFSNMDVDAAVKEYEDLLKEMVKPDFYTNLHPDEDSIPTSGSEQVAESVIDSNQNTAEVLNSLQFSDAVTGQWVDLLSKANSCDSASIIGILDRLPKTPQDDPQAIALFKSFLSALDLSKMAGFAVQVNSTNDITWGDTNFDNNTIRIAINDKARSVMNPSPATIYMHEVMHAILNYAFTERYNNPRMNALIEQIRTVQEQASHWIRWQDFLDDPKNYTQDEVVNAKKLWDYVFANKDPDDRGLKEFLSYAISDKTFIEILRRHKVKDAKVSLYTRIKTFFHMLMDILCMRSTLAEVAGKQQWFRNNTLNAYNGKDYYSTVTQLVKDIQEANAKATFAMNIGEKAIYGFYGLVNTLRQLGNKYIGKLTRNIFTWSKANPYTTDFANSGKYKKAAVLLGSLPFSHATRQYWYDMVSGVATTYHKEDIRLLLDDFGSLDHQREVLDTYARNSRAVEAYYQQTKDLVVQSLKAGFGRDLSQDEYDALTDVVMSTDLQCLYDGKNLADLKRLMTYKVSRDKAIMALQDTDFEMADIAVLNPKTGKKESFEINLSAESQARLKKGVSEISSRWAYVMYYGKGDNFIGSADNIDTIGERIGLVAINSVVNNDPQLQALIKLDKDIRNTLVSSLLKEVKQRINKAATIKALGVIAQKEPNKLALVNKLEAKGLNVFLQEHQGYIKNVKGTDSELERRKTKGKGFTQSIYNESMDFVIAPLSDQKMLEYNGYVLVDNVHDKKNLLLENDTHLELKNNVSMGIFTRRAMVLDKRSNSAFTFVASKWASKDLYSYLSEGMSLDEATSGKVIKNVDNRIINKQLQIDQRDAMVAWKTQQELEHEAFTKLKHYRDKMVFDAFNLHTNTSTSQMEKDILETAFDGDSYHPLTRQESQEKLKLSRNSFDILSKMVATQTTFNKGKQQNIALVKLLNSFAAQNMSQTTHRDIHTRKKYINITDRLVNELHISKDVLCEDAYVPGQPLPDIWAREDFVERIFGVTSVNLSRATYKSGVKKGYSKYPPMVRGAFEVLEMLLKLLAYKEKETIVMRKPSVLIGNVLSNLSYNTLSEPNTWKVIRMQLANVRNTNNYLQAQRRLQEIEHTERLRDLTSQEKAEKIRMKQQMNNNPIASLFKSGMFTSIVEDVPLKDRAAVQDYFDNFTKNKYIQMIPKPIKTVFNQLYMRPGSTLFDAFYNINKYSDFVARATEYQIQMEKHKDEIAANPARKSIIEQDILHDIWNAFIDYDRPNGKVEQYLNDMGILMFTKYAKGIQRVIMKQLTTNPAGLMVHLAREFVVPFEIDDIFEQNVFNKKWSMLIHNPIMNAIDIAIPPLPRLILGLL